MIDPYAALKKQPAAVAVLLIVGFALFALGMLTGSVYEWWGSCK